MSDIERNPSAQQLQSEMQKVCVYDLQEQMDHLFVLHGEGIIKYFQRQFFAFIANVCNTIVMYNERVKSFKCIERRELNIILYSQFR